MSEHFRNSFIIESKEQANLLLQPKTLHYLAPFISKARSASEAARLLGVRLTTLLYQLERLNKSGLLSYEEKPRAGSSIKLYHACAQHFFIPFDLTPYSTYLEWLQKEYESVEKRFLEGFLAASLQLLDNPDSEDFGLWVQLAASKLQVRHGLHPDSNLQLDLSAPDAPALLNVWDDNLKLSFRDAKTLQRELREVFDNYRIKEGSGRYLIRLGLSPLAD